MSAPVLNNAFLVVGLGRFDCALALRDHRLRQLDPFRVAAGPLGQHQEVADLDQGDRLRLHRIPFIFVGRHPLEGAFLGV